MFAFFLCFQAHLNICMLWQHIVRKKKFPFRSRTTHTHKHTHTHTLFQGKMSSSIYPNSRWPPGNPYFPCPRELFRFPTSTQLGWEALRTNTPTPTLGRSLFFVGAARGSIFFTSCWIIKKKKKPTCFDSYLALSSSNARSSNGVDFTRTSKFSSLSLCISKAVAFVLLVQVCVLLIQTYCTI